MIYLLALFIGVVAGLRAMMAPAAVSWAARAGALDLAGTRLAFLGNSWVPWLFTVLALFELVTDQLPTTPSRTVPAQFTARIGSGALCGAAVGHTAGTWMIGAVLGAAGAVIGTIGGHGARARLAQAFGRDRPAAVVEDAVAIAGAVLIAVGIA